MKFLRRILRLVLVLAFFNVIVGKAVHEYFEHHEQIHACIDKDTIHFHEFEFEHPDFICDFNLSTTFLNDFVFHTKSRIPYFQKQLITKHLWIVVNSCLNNLRLRGPPSIK